MGTVNGVNLNIVGLFSVGGNVYGIWDPNNNGIGSIGSGGGDTGQHNKLDTLLNGGADTIATTGVVKGVNDARTVIAGGYTIVLPTVTELLGIYNGGKSTVLSTLAAQGIYTYWAADKGASADTHYVLAMYSGYFTPGDTSVALYDEYQTVGPPGIITLFQVL